MFLLLIFATGMFLRVYKIGINYFFTGELGKELLYMRQFVVNHSFPIIGMTTSHEWLSYGPIYYWIMIPIFKLFNGDPFILFWTALVVSFLGLIANYLVFKKIAGEKIAVFSTMIQALSPLLIWQVRLSKLHVFFFLMMPIFTYLLYFLWNGKGKWVILAGIVFGILFSFHFSQIPILVVVMLLFWIRKDVYKVFDWIKFGIGVLIPNITLIWQDRNLALWLPYRILNIPDKDPSGTAQLLNEYLGKNIFWDHRLWIIGTLVFVIIFIHYFVKNRQRFTKDFLPFYLISSISIMLIANIVHGAPPVHYFLPIFTTVPVLFAIYLERYKFWPLILVPILLINLASFSLDPQFYGDVSNLKSYSSILKSDPATDFIPYSKQEAVAYFIISNSKKMPFSIKRVGPYDYFPENYSQNYKYLILWHGGNLIDSSKNVYTITEDPEKGEVDVQK